MPRARQTLPRIAWLVGCFMPFGLAALAPAQSVDVSLNVFYNNPANVHSGGTWELVAKSSHAGIAGVSVFLTDISTAQNEAPRGIVNGSDPAGFSRFDASNSLGLRNLTIVQDPITLGEMDEDAEQSVFYGVGTLSQGAVAYPAQPAGTSAIGPEFTSLTSVADLPWAMGDVFENAAWDSAARLASGTFAPGLVPGFSQASGDFQNTANVFTTLGTSSTYGTIAEAAIAAFVRTNLIGSALPDYDDNGLVDVADYVLWRNTFGQQGGGLAADGNQDGIVNQADYDLWRASFGAVAAAVASLPSARTASVLAIPEPHTVFLFMSGAGMLFSIRRRRAATKDI
jgi:hypothetical protein